MIHSTNVQTSWGIITVPTTHSSHSQYSIANWGKHPRHYHRIIIFTKGTSQWVWGVAFMLLGLHNFHQRQEDIYAWMSAAVTLNFCTKAVSTCASLRMTKLHFTVMLLCCCSFRCYCFPNLWIFLQQYYCIFLHPQPVFVRIAICMCKKGILVSNTLKIKLQQNKLPSYLATECHY